MREDKIISALVGLVGACGNHSRTESSDNVIIKALAYPVLCRKPGDGGIAETVEEIYSEKNAVAPKSDRGLIALA